VLLDRRARERGLVDATAVDRLLTAHAEGRTDGGDRIWSLLNLELWHRTFIDKDGVKTLSEAAGPSAPGPRPRGIPEQAGVQTALAPPAEVA